MKNKNPKIIILIPSFDIGGAERQAFQFAQYYKDNRNGEIEIFGLFNPGKISKLCESAGISWKLVPYPSSRFLPLRFFTLVRLTTEFRKAKPDIILSYTFVPNVICGLIWKWTGAKLCIWNQRDGGIHYDIPFLERHAVKNIPDYISNSHQGAQYLNKEFGISLSAIKLIPNGVELSPPQKTRIAWRTSLHVDECTFTACMVANLTCLKDHETLLRSWKIVINSIHDEKRRPVLLLAGKQYENYRRLVAFVHQNNIEDYIRFLGQVDDISGLLASTDLGIYCSKREGCPNGLLECMAAGLPVIATDIPSNREALGRTRNVCFVPVGDANALADKIRIFLNDKIIRDQEGIRNSQRIIEKFSLAKTNFEMVNFILSRYRKKI